MSGGSGDRYYTQGAPTRTGSNNRGISSNRGLGSATSPRGYHGAQPPLGVGARLLGSPGRNTSSSLVQQRAALPKPDGNLCSYSLYECNTERLTGYEFCLRHILCDKNAPYKPCGYCGDSQSGLKCSRPAPCFNRGDSYCAQHTRVILAARQRSSKKRKSTPNILLESLASYKKSKVDNKTPADESTSSLPALNPFQQRFDPEAEGLGLAALESDGLQIESEDMLIRDTYTGGGDGESEGESVDSEGEDSLQLAGVYTVEEVMRILKDKLVKLQKLYIDQFQRLVFKMKESRREYLVQLKEEKDAGLVNISDQPNKDLEYERLKAMMHYFCPSGREALLSTKHRDKRLSLSGSSSKQTSFCQHTLTTTTKCNGVCVPMAKFCQKHILEEQGQVLYRACGVVTPADGPCETPVAALFSHTTCVFHTKIPVFNPSVHTDGEESNDKPPEPTEDDVSVKPVNKEDSISVQPVTKEYTISDQTRTDVTNNTIQNNHDQKLKQETGLDPITPDLKNSNLGKQSESLIKIEAEESKLQLAGSYDTIIKKEVVDGEVIEKMDVDVNDQSKSEVLTDDRIVKKESESKQTLLTKEIPIEKTVDNEKVKEQHLDMSENKTVEANNQHDNRTDVDMKDGFVDPEKNSKDIKGKISALSDKELDGKNHEMDIEETDNKADVSESNDYQASIVEAKVEDEEKSNKKSSKEKEIEESIKNDSSSIEKIDKSIEEKDEVTEKSNEVIEKNDEVTVETDDIAQKLEGVPDKSDKVTEKSDEVTDESDEVTEETDKMDEVTEKTDEATEESDEVKEKSDEVTEKSEEVTEKSQEAKEKIDEVKVKTADIAKKTNEETAKSDKPIFHADEVTEITDEVTEIRDEVADKSDEVTDKSDNLTVQADEVADKTDEVVEKTDEVAKKTDEETAKSNKLTVQADEVTYVTDEVTEITDEVVKKTDEVAKKTEEVAEESNVDTSKSDKLSK